MSGAIHIEKEKKSGCKNAIREILPDAGNLISV